MNDGSSPSLLRAKMGDKFSLTDFHDRLLAGGLAPLKIIRREMIVDGCARVRHDARNPSRVQMVDRHARITPGLPAKPS